jgi:hypothetical protein
MARFKRPLPTNNRGAAYRIIRASQAAATATAAAAATALDPPVVMRATRGRG